MPFTPYHFGPSAFIGLVFRKWIDIPVFILANVVVDVEVLVVGILGLGWPIHRYCHTLLIGAAVGALWGIAAYRLRHLFRGAMNLLDIPYRTSIRKMVISGVLGVWLHVLIDGAYHFDVKMFWPSKSMWLWLKLHRRIGQGQMKLICLALFVAACILYLLSVKVFRRNLAEAK
ncbi:MAG TPA: hypothetical protein DIU00_08855 [Phycisphaerales bacterium]|mgnify:CR=1 FL=1|nr:hypothetical protein [Phycisphaerales bacterium]